MDFELNVNGEVEVFTKYHEMEDRVRNLIAEWNNFHPEKTLSISLNKIPNDIPTLGISVNDGIETKDIFGQS